MNRSVVSFMCLAAFVLIGAGPAVAAEPPAGTAIPATASGIGSAAGDVVASQFDTHIDTWVEGVVTKLDVEVPTVTVAGHVMPYASAFAGMLRDVAAKTAELDASAKEAKAQEVRLSWQEKLSKASLEDRSADTSFNCRLPAKGLLTIKTEDKMANLDFMHHEKGMAMMPAQPKAGEVGAPIVPARNDQELAKNDVAKTADQIQSEALVAFGQLKVGDPVYLGYASGLLSNDAYSIIKRNSLQPTAPGKTR